MASRIAPKNLTAQLSYNARGNPPGAHPVSAVGNFFPGLEFNFLNIWKRILIDIELLESSGEVIGVASGAAPEIRSLLGARLIYVGAIIQNGRVTDPGTPVFTTVRGPSVNPDGTKGPVSELGQIFLEWGNVLADLHHDKGGEATPVNCIFVDSDGNTQVVPLRVRRIMEPDSALISREATEPGELTESLCSPWQTDFIGCACYYWSANRPDYINIWNASGGGGGHNWLNQARENDANGKPFYTLEPGKTLEHEDIMQDWEKKLKFIIGGKDEQ